MSINLRYPNITGLSEREQLSQMKSYLHQLVEQLNYALPLSASEGASSVNVQGGELSFYELRSLIIQQLQEVETRFNQLSQKMQSEYVKDDELDEKMGNLDELDTEDKSNLVAAINELAQSLGGEVFMKNDGSGNAFIFTTSDAVSITDDGNGNVTIAKEV